MERYFKVVIFILIVALVGLMSMACSNSGGDGAMPSDESNESVSNDNLELNGDKVTPRNDKTFKIGYSNFDLVHNSYVALEKTFGELVTENAWEYVLTNAEGDINKQIADMEDLASQNCDIIFVNTFDPEMLTPTINSIVEQGVPIVSFDNKLSDDAKVLTTIQADNRKNGILVGEWIAKKMKGQPIKAVIISGTKGANICVQRRQGMIEGIIEEKMRNEGEADLEIVAQVYTDWYPDVAVKAMEDILSRGVEFNVLLSEADVMAMQCMQALEDAGKLEGKLIACPADAQKEALEIIKTTDIYATGLNNFVAQAEYGVDTIKKWMNGETNFPDITYTPAVAITRENVDEYYDPNAPF